MLPDELGVSMSPVALFLKNSCKSDVICENGRRLVRWRWALTINSHQAIHALMKRCLGDVLGVRHPQHLLEIPSPGRLWLLKHEVSARPVLQLA